MVLILGFGLKPRQWAMAEGFVGFGLHDEVTLLLGSSELKQEEFLYKAVVTTDNQGESVTKFIKVDLTTGDESETDLTLNEQFKFPVGNEIEISQIDGALYIKTTTPLDGQLEVQ